VFGEIYFLQHLPSNHRIFLLSTPYGIKTDNHLKVSSFSIQKYIWNIHKNFQWLWSILEVA